MHGGTHSCKNLLGSIPNPLTISEKLAVPLKNRNKTVTTFVVLSA